MPTSRTPQPHWRHADHPLRQALSYAAAGQDPTPDELAAIPGYRDDLDVRIKVNGAVKKIHAARGEDGVIDNVQATRERDSALDTIGEQIAGRDLPPDTRPEPESLETITARMFRR